MTIALGVLVLAGAFYLSLAIVRVVRFGRTPVAPRPEFAPAITVLKPVAGDEPGLYENLASFCRQSYPDYDVIFCVHGAGDAAMPTIERVIRDHPACTASVAAGNNAAMHNPKIANLAKPGVEPRGEIVVIADSDINVGADYLWAIAGDFTSERVGAATCLYRGAPRDELISRLGALQIEDGFAPSVLVALALGPLRFCLGATMAVRASVLTQIGGLRALGDHLADDHALGTLVAEAGHDVALSRYVVATTVPETTLRDLWNHELRWARTNLAQAPAGYAFSFVMYALPIALLFASVAPRLGLLALAVVAALRLTLHYATRWAFGVTRRDDVWFVPLRDVLSLATWAASFASKSVLWRSQRYRT